MDQTSLEPSTTRLEASRVRPLSRVDPTNLDNIIINLFIVISQRARN